VADAFQQAAVAGEDRGAMIDDVRAELGRQHAFGDRHPDRVAEALAERPRRHLDPARMAALGMPRRAAAELAETLDLIQRHLFVAGQVEQRVEQHRTVPGRQHEAVAVRPVRVERIELQEAAEQHGGDIGHAHGHAGMAGIGLLDGVHGERADGVGHVAMADGGRRRGGGTRADCFHDRFRSFRRHDRPLPSAALLRRKLPTEPGAVNRPLRGPIHDARRLVRC
jgi:hypothetical protein